MSSRDPTVSVQNSGILSRSRIKQRIKSLRYIRYRYIIAILLSIGSFAYFLTYFSFPRSFRHLHELGPNYNSNYSIDCKFEKHISRVRHVDGDFYKWGKEFYQILQQAPALGIMVSSIPSGVLSDKHGGKYFVLVPIIVLSVIEVVVPPMLCGADVEFYVLFIWEFLIGVGGAIVLCGTNSIVAQWTPLEERGRLASIVYCGIPFAVTFHHGINDNFILATEMWNAPFFVYAAVGLIWSGFFVFFGFSYYYTKNRWLRQEELDFLKKQLGNILIYYPLTILRR